MRACAPAWQLRSRAPLQRAEGQGCARRRRHLCRTSAGCCARTGRPGRCWRSWPRRAAGPTRFTRGCSALATSRGVHWTYAERRRARRARRRARRSGCGWRGRRYRCCCAADPLRATAGCGSATGSWRWTELTSTTASVQVGPASVRTDAPPGDEGRGVRAGAVMWRRGRGRGAAGGDDWRGHARLCGAARGRNAGRGRAPARGPAAPRLGGAARTHVTAPPRPSPPPPPHRGGPRRGAPEHGERGWGAGASCLSCWRS